jgi:peptidyl-prolyl cis-trans isomerase D
MFDFIRSHQRLMQLFLLLLIVPSFVFFGVQGYERMNQQTASVAKVAGQPITSGELDDAVRQQVNRMRAQYGASLDAAMFDTPESKALTLDGLIQQHVLMAQADRASLSTSDRKLQDAIGAIPALQVDGKFDQDRYQAILAQQGMTPAMFEQRMRADLAVQQLSSAIESSAIAPKSVVDRFSVILTQRREVRPLVFKAADYATQVKLAPDAVQKEYDAHPDEFTTPEHAKVEYLVLSSDSIAKQVKISDPDAMAFYESNKKRYEVPEQRRASHILVAVAKDASEADKAKAKAKAEDILKKVKAAPGDFAKLAKQYSDDPGSAQNGGDLDYVGRGAFVPPFESALYALKEKEISDLVQSDFGYHIIELTGIKPAQIKPFDSVKGEIVAELQQQEAKKRFADAQEGFSNGVYEQADSLAPTAQKFGLAVQTADDVSRTPAAGADAATNPLASAKLLDSLFSADSLKDHHNTEAVEASPGVLVSARIASLTPASRLPIDKVTETIRKRLTDAEASRLALEAANAALAQLKKGDGTAAKPFGPALTISRNQASGLPADAVTALFRADATKLPAYAGPIGSGADYAIYQIASISNGGDANPVQRAQLNDGLGKQLGSIELAAYLADLRRRSKVQISAPYADIIEKKDAAPAKAG